jgi:hypothetical protein
MIGGESINCEGIIYPRCMEMGGLAESTWREYEYTAKGMVRSPRVESINAVSPPVSDGKSQ